METGSLSHLGKVNQHHLKLTRAPRANVSIVRPELVSNPQPQFRISIQAVTGSPSKVLGMVVVRVRLSLLEFIYQMTVADIDSKNGHYERLRVCCGIKK